MSGLLVASLAFGCSGDSKPEGLELTATRDTYPYDPAEAGPKGSGDLGQAENPLKAGTIVVAVCVDRPEAYQKDSNDKADAIRIKAGEFAGMLVPLQVYPNVDGKIGEEPVNVFILSPDEIRGEIDFC